MNNHDNTIIYLDDIEIIKLSGRHHRIELGDTIYISDEECIVTKIINDQDTKVYTMLSEKYMKQVICLDGGTLLEIEDRLNNLGYKLVKMW